MLTYHLGLGVDIPRVKIDRIPRVPWIKEVPVGPSFRKALLDIILLAKTLRSLLRSRYDLIYTHEEASLFGALLSRIFNVRHLYDLHSSLPQFLLHFRWGRIRPLVAVFKWIERTAIAFSDVVITISPALRDHVTRIGEKAPVKVIENSMSLFEGSSPSKRDLRSLELELDIPKGHRIVLYTGTFESYQALEVLLESAAQVIARRTDTMFVLVGGKRDQIKKNEQVVQTMGLTRHFRFAGTRHPHCMPLFYELSHVLVSPRARGENAPLKIYSYLESGKPIVASNNNVHTQVLNQKTAILVPLTAEAFCYGILFALENPEAAKGIGENAKRLYEENYCSSRYLEKMGQALQLALR
jgi:glycosyltransferase involved in cell wall biosynthesis